MVRQRTATVPTAGDEVLNFFCVGNHPAADLCNGLVPLLALRTYPRDGASAQASSRR